VVETVGMKKGSEPKEGSNQHRVLGQLREGPQHRSEIAKRLGFNVDQVKKAIDALRERGWEITRVGRVYGLWEFEVDEPQAPPRQPEKILHALQDGPKRIEELAAITGDHRAYALRLIDGLRKRGHRIEREGDVFRLAS